MANRITSVPKKVTTEGTAQSNYPTTGGPNGPGAASYPTEYGKLVGSFNNGRNSASGPSTAPATGNYPNQASVDAYRIGKQKKVAEAP